LEVPAALERSRSGNGRHVWMFFDEAVPAALARKLRSCLLAETIGTPEGIDAELRHLRVVLSG
jgi:hypothetical protein